jgi:fatty acid desaturase
MLTDQAAFDYEKYVSVLHAKPLTNFIEAKHFFFFHVGQQNNVIVVCPHGRKFDQARATKVEGFRAVPTENGSPTRGNTRKERAGFLYKGSSQRFPLTRKLMKKKSPDVISVLLKEDRGNPQPEMAYALAESPVPAKPINDYVELKKLIKKDGLLDKQPIYYTYKIITTLGLMALSVVFLFVVHNFWFQIFNAILLAVASAQLGFLGHDGGHRQIFHSTRKNEILALCTGDLLIGMSNGWWLDKHNRHHSHPNETDMDPDIDLGVVAFSEEDVLSKRGIERLIVRHQKYFFFPLLSLVSIDLQKSSILYLIQHKDKYRWTEALLLLIHHVLYLGMLFYCLNPWQAVIFMLIHQLMFGIFLGSAFAPNHKGMPILEKGSTIDFLRRQVLTARNVHSGFFNDFWYGGLNYQVEHHLFPSMPRNNLKKAQKLVRTYCQEHAIAYYETSSIQSFREILQFLHQVSAPLRIPNVQRI